MSGSSARLEAFLASPDPDGTFLAQMAELVAGRRAGLPVRGGSAPLSWLLLGYNGAGNIGADARVAEILRQMRAVFGDQVAPVVALVSETAPDDLFEGAALEPLGAYAADHLDAASLRHDGVVVCEGSMFKSDHADLLCGMLAGALGLWDAGGRLAVGYGGDAGRMSPGLEALVAGMGRGPLVLCRSAPSRVRLDGLGVRTMAGSDTGWTFEPAAPAVARARLESLGCGAGPLLVVCPINPFWWPVQADPGRAAGLAERGEPCALHYGSVFFHADSPARRAAYGGYLDALAAGIEAWRARHGGSVVLVGMERLDRRAVDALGGRLSFGAGRLVSGDAPAREVVAVLREADLLVSSRYHAIVLTMAAHVPSVGVSMDERIGNLLAGCGCGHRVLRVDEPGLSGQLDAAMREAGEDRAAHGVAMDAELARQLRAMAGMGAALAAEAVRRHPWLRVPPVDAGLRAFLPRLAPRLDMLLDAA